jgi:hypothetical protein
MSQSRTLLIGMDVHKDTMAGAYGAQAHGAAVTSLGTLGTRPCDSEQRVRKRPSKAPLRSASMQLGPGATGSSGL